VSTHTKKELQAIVDLLKPLLVLADSSALKQTLMTFGLPFLCSKAFIDFCRIRNEKPLVLLLSSLAVSNDLHGVWSQRILDIYQTLTKDGELSGNLSELAPRHILRQSIAFLADKTPINLSKGLLGSAQDVCLSIELLLDYDKADSAYALMKMQWGKTNIDVHLLELAKAILARQSNNGIQLHCVNQWIEIYEFIYSKLLSTDFESVKEQFALIIAENHLAAKHATETLAWCKHVHNPQDTLKAHYYRAKAMCLAKDMSGSLKAMDELLAGVPDQSREWLESAFKTPGGGKSNFNLEAAQAALKDMQKVMQTIDKKLFLVSGTLLGYERVGDFLSHDKDIDVGIYGSNDQFEIIQALSKSRLFHVPMQDIKLTDNFYIPSYHTPTGMPIDVFVYHLVNGKLRTGVQNTFGYLQHFDFTPFELQSIEFVGVPTHAPSDIDLNLRENFGNWRVSDPHYISHLESPSTVDVGGPIYQLVARLELLRYIVEQKTVKGTRVCQKLRGYTHTPLGMSEELLCKIEDIYGFAPTSLAVN
jgi:hypothetical protein